MASEKIMGNYTTQNKTFRVEIKFKEFKNKALKGFVNVMIKINSNFIKVMKIIVNKYRPGVRVIHILHSIRS